MTAIGDAFDQWFPDRAALTVQTGCSLDDIAIINAYAEADHSIGFPTEDDVFSLVEAAGSVTRSVASAD